MPRVSTSRVLARPGTPISSACPPRQQRDQGLLDHLGLTEDDLADALAHEAEAFAERLDLGNEIARRRR